jgi:hypothetical protein
VSLLVFLIIVIVIFGGGGFGWHAGWYGNGSPYGYGIFGGLGGILLLILIVMALSGRL